MLLDRWQHVGQDRRTARPGDREEVGKPGDPETEIGLWALAPLLVEPPSAHAADVDLQKRAGHRIKAGGEDDGVDGVFPALRPDAGRCYRLDRFAADVDQDVAVEVRLFLELLDVVPVAAREDLPVDGGQVVAVDVLPVLREFDAEAFEGAAMKPGEKAFDDRARLQLERAQARHDRGVEKPPFAGERDHVYIPLFGTGTVSRSRSTMASESTRSDSA